MTRPYRVLSWVTNAVEPYIKVKPLPPVSPTKPRIRTWINAGLTEGELVDGHLRKGENGFIAECQMQITERVEGFYEGASGLYKAYQELREKNPNLRPRMRQFRTTGVIIAIEEDWF
jgi:DEAD/DEAH box helicase domain-containing protein